MVFSPEDFCRKIELIKKRIPYKILIKIIKENGVLLLSEIKNPNEMAEFIEAYEAVTQSSFSIIANKTASNNLICRKKWTCNHSIVSGLNKKCPASISILVKRNLRNVLQEAFSRKFPPLPAVIKINPKHNHSLETPLTELMLVKISNGVKLCFYEYFKRGYFGGRAKLLHEQNLQKANFFTLDDESMNPTVRAIYTLGSNWLKRKENMGVYKASDNKSSLPIPVTNVQKENNIGKSSSKNLENCLNTRDVFRLKKDPDDEYIATKHIAKEIVEDIKPVLTIKQEVIDEDVNNELPVISSYCSLTVPSFSRSPTYSVKVSTVKKSAKQNIAYVVEVQPSPSQVAMYGSSLKTYKFIKCLSLNADAYSTGQCKSYLPSGLLPMRLSLQRL